MRNTVKVSGMLCEIERIRVTARERAIGYPIAEVLAPEGFEFSGGETALEIHSAKDLDEIEKSESLLPV